MITMSSDPQGWLATFQQLLDGGRLDEAEQLARQRLAQAPPRRSRAARAGPGAHPARRSGRRRRSRLPRDRAAAERRVLHHAGGIHGAAGRADESALSFELALKIQPDFAPAVDNLAVLNYHRYHVDEAITDSEECMSFSRTIPCT
jgi:tetratricopeptide (TPR) repeat protein